jgi:hypothetical protein
MGPLNVGMPKMAYVGLALVALGVWKCAGQLEMGCYGRYECE